MARTKSFKELVQHHVKRDAKFAEALLREGVDAMLSGDVETGKTILRDYIKATVGFEKLGAATGAPPKSLIRMFGPRGNPQAKNLFSVIGYLQKRAGLSGIALKVLETSHTMRLAVERVFLGKDCRSIFAVINIVSVAKHKAAPHDWAFRPKARIP